jgi:hypothetical protein
LARFLALDWDHNQLHVVLANVSGGTVRAVRAASWREDAPVTAAEAAAVGARLKDRLKEAKIPSAPVLACLGRERIIVKDIRYPQVPEHEEPAVVRFQALKELTGAADEVVLDYTPVGEGGHGERRALVLIAKRALVSAYQELCQEAGLKLAGVTPRPFGLAACVEKLAGTSVLTPAPEPADGVVGTLAVADGWAEFCVSRGSTLLLARSLAPGPNLAAEVRRSLAVYAGQGSGQPVRALYVSGAGDNAALRERLHNLTELPVHLLDPFTGSDLPDLPPPDERGGFAALVGLLHLRGGRAGLPVNFVAPKQPRAPADPNRRMFALAGAAVLAVLVAVGLLAWLEVNKLDRQVREQAERNRQLDSQLALYEEDEKRAKAVGAWVDQDVPLLDEIYDLTDRFPDPDKDKVRLSQVTFNVIDQTPNAKDKDKEREKVKYVAQIKDLKGVCDDERPVDHMLSSFITDGHYRTPNAKETRPLRGPEALAGFTREFTVKTIDIEKRKPTDYKRQIPPDADAGPPRRRGAGQ